MSKKPDYNQIRAFATCLEIIGFTPDRDRTCFQKVGAYFTISVNIRNTTKGEFKELSARIIMRCLDYATQTFPRVVEFKPCKALSIEYVQACEDCAQFAYSALKAAFDTIIAQAAAVNPKEFLKKELEE